MSEGSKSDRASPSPRSEWSLEPNSGNKGRRFVRDSPHLSLSDEIEDSEPGTSTDSEEDNGHGISHFGHAAAETNRRPTRRPIRPSAKRHTADALSALGENYEHFLAAFGLAPKPPNTPKPSTMNANRKRAAGSEKPQNPTKRRKINDSSAVSTTYKESPVIPARRPAEDRTHEGSPGRTLSTRDSNVPVIASSPRDSRSTLMPPPKSAIKGLAQKVDKPPEPKGSGLYKTGNWTWVSDDDEEEKVNEKITAEAQQISAIIEASSQPPAKITRGAFREMKSKLGGEDFATPPPRTSNRATQLRKQRSKRSGSSPRPTRSPLPRRSLIISLHIPKGGRIGRSPNLEDVDHEMIDAPQSEGIEASPPPGVEFQIAASGNVVDDSDGSREQRTSLEAHSASASSFSNRSTLVPEQPTVANSRSSVPDEISYEASVSPVQHTKPKRTWNAIVYEVIAHSTSPAKPTLTYPEIVEGVKKHYPFYAEVGQSKTLESSPRNPLYAHEAFYKEERPDKTNAWGLRPGEFYDRKANKILTAGPRPPALGPVLKDRHTSEDRAKNHTESLPKKCTFEQPISKSDAEKHLNHSALPSSSIAGAPLASTHVDPGAHQDPEGQLTLDPESIKPSQPSPPLPDEMEVMEDDVINLRQRDLNEARGRAANEARRRGLTRRLRDDSTNGQQFRDVVGEPSSNGLREQHGNASSHLVRPITGQEPMHTPRPAEKRSVSPVQTPVGRSFPSTAPTPNGKLVSSSGPTPPEGKDLGPVTMSQKVRLKKAGLWKPQLSTNDAETRGSPKASSSKEDNVASRKRSPMAEFGAALSAGFEDEEMADAPDSINPESSKRPEQLFKEDGYPIIPFSQDTMADNILKLNAMIAELENDVDPAEFIRDSQEDQKAPVVQASPEVIRDSQESGDTSAKVISPFKSPALSSMPPNRSQQRALSMPQPHVERHPALLQPRTLSVSETQDLRRLESLLNRNLAEEFTDAQVIDFIQETKIDFFRTMDLQARDVAKALKITHPNTSRCRSTEGDMEQCAQDLRRDYEEHMWASQWFLNFVTREANLFNNAMKGSQLSYNKMDYSMRKEFWKGSTKFSKDNCKKLLSSLSDAVDFEAVWSNKHWQGYLQKLWAEAADAMWFHRLQPNAGLKSHPSEVFTQIRKALNDRYKDRDDDKWEVPRVCHEPPSTSSSIPSSEETSILSSKETKSITASLRSTLGSPPPTLPANPPGSATPSKRAVGVPISPRHSGTIIIGNATDRNGRESPVYTSPLAPPSSRPVAPPQTNIRSPQVRTFNNDIFRSRNGQPPVPPRPGFYDPLMGAYHSVPPSPTTREEAAVLNSSGRMAQRNRYYGGDGANDDDMDIEVPETQVVVID